MRLLKIQPGEGDDPIRGELVIISTNSQQIYDAVSYTWADQTGDSTRRFRAFIGTSYVLITRSCQEVLQRIRSRFYTKCVWIDSVCVDQDNLQERGHQVQLMPRIYTRAKKTYVYVGPTTCKDDSLLETLAAGRVEHSWGAEEESLWVAFNNFLRRPYFFRVWIIQEIALSLNPVIICGEKEFPWSVLQNDTLLQSLPKPLSIRLRERVVSPLLSLGKRRLRSSAELTDLLQLGRHCESTDPRDRVFALLGLVVGAEAEGLVADYGWHVAQVFTWIARYLAKVGTAADLLGNVNMIRNSAWAESLGFRNELQLPSWVPDWTDSGTTSLDLFPQATNYLKNLRFQLDEIDMSALILTGFEKRYTSENRPWIPFPWGSSGDAIFARRYKQWLGDKRVRGCILFQCEQERPGPEVPEFLMILAIVNTDSDANLEVPEWQYHGAFPIPAHGGHKGYLTCWFGGLLHITKTDPHKYECIDSLEVTIKLI